MTCENFRVEFNRMLDKKSTSLLSEEMQSHISVCTNCAEYRTSLLSIHKQLVAVTRLTPSAELIQQLKSIKYTRPLQAKPNWSRDIWRTVTLLCPAILMMFSNYLPLIPSFIINTVALTAGLVLLFTKLLTPIFFTRY